MKRPCNISSNMIPKSLAGLSGPHGPHGHHGGHGHHGRVYRGPHVIDYQYPYYPYPFGYDTAPPTSQIDLRSVEELVKQIQKNPSLSEQEKARAIANLVKIARA